MLLSDAPCLNQMKKQISPKKVEKKKLMRDKARHLFTMKFEFIVLYTVVVVIIIVLYVGETFIWIHMNSPWTFSV